MGENSGHPGKKSKPFVIMYIHIVLSMTPTCAKCFIGSVPLRTLQIVASNRPVFFSLKTSLTNLWLPFSPIKTGHGVEPVFQLLQETLRI
jgi:hypothetical protein